MDVEVGTIIVDRSYQVAVKQGGKTLLQAQTFILFTIFGIKNKTKHK